MSRGGEQGLANEALRKGRARNRKAVNIEAPGIVFLAWKKLSLLQKPPSDFISDGSEQSGENKAVNRQFFFFFLSHSKDISIKEAAGGKVGKGGGRGKQREVVARPSTV